MVLSTGAIAITMFCLFVMLVAFVIVVMLYRDIQNRQKVHSSFSNHLSEFLVLMTKEGRLQDTMPKNLADPLYEQLCENGRFEGILPNPEMERLNDYIRNLNTYPDIPFVLPFLSEEGKMWYELRVTVLKNGNQVYLLRNVTQDLKTKSQRDKVQRKMDLLLQSTGDFLWRLDVEKRQFSLLTPISDDEGRVVPRSVGVQDLRTLLPEADYAIFDKMVNARVIEFRSTGRDNEENQTLKLRLFGMDGNKVWYALRCKVGNDENGRLMINGTARRMEMFFEGPVFDEEQQDALLSAAFSFPDFYVFCLNRDNRFVGCNQSFASEYHYSNAKLIRGKLAQDVIKTKYFNFLQGIITRPFETGRPAYWKGTLGDAKQVLILNSTPVKKDDAVLSVLCTYTHIRYEDFENTINPDMEK